MKIITYKKSIGLLKSNAVLAVLGGLLLSSCGATMGGYSETDGVYYDPNSDTIPVGVVMNSGNQVGEYYDYQQMDDQNIYLNSENRNQSWQESQNSDWGDFTGTETYYNDSWGYPYGYSSGFGYGLSFGFGSSWGYGGYYNPWGFMYNPFGGYYSPYSGYYNQFYGYNPYYGYSPYGYNPYGYYSPYGYGYGYGGHNSYNAPAFNSKRSGADGSGFRPNTSAVRSSNNQNSGFRNGSTRNNTPQNSIPRYNTQQNNSQPRYRTSPQSNGPTYRQSTTPRQNTTPRQSTPNYNQQSRSNSNDNGFRSGGNSGTSSSNSSSTRSSGGFRR